MSSGLKWVVALVVIIIAGVALWQSGLINLSPSPLPAEQTASSTPAQSGLPTAQSDTSDAALTQDSAAIDAQLSGMSQDSAAVDQSLQDQPGQQSF